MRSVAVPVLLTICLLVVGLSLGVGAGMADGGESPASIEQPAEPILVYDISIDDNGTATWLISAKFPIGEPDQQDAFDEIAEKYLNDEEDTYLSVGAYDVAADELATALDRPMAIEASNRSVTRSDEVGTLELSFRWVGFGSADNHSVTVGDVFTATERPWLSTLQDDEFLRIHAPSGYAIETSGMPVDNRTAWMDGPADLSESELQTVFVREAQFGSNGDGDQGTDEPSGSLILPVMGGALGILGLIAIGLALGHRAGWAPVSAAVAALRDSDEQDSDGVTDESDEDGGEQPKSTTEDLELLSDEERVLQLIEDHGGRMKQAAIVEETDWSNAKVSQLLSEMAESGSIEKLRIGRENLISLPDFENGR